MKTETGTIAAPGGHLAIPEDRLNDGETKHSCVLVQNSGGAGEPESCLYGKQTEYLQVDGKAFRVALGTFCSGVTIVTFHLDRCFYGLTVSSFCSLSLDPPLILACINQHCQSHNLLGKAKSFAVNVLAENSERLARQFASRARDKFANVPYHLGQLGSPLLNDALTTLECFLVEQIPSGDHSIFIGKVISAHVRDDARPLTYYRGQFLSGIAIEVRQLTER